MNAPITGKSRVGKNAIKCCSLAVYMLCLLGPRSVSNIDVALQPVSLNVGIDIVFTTMFLDNLKVIAGSSFRG